MSLLVLFRTRLEWCNYTCGYCPWNATARRLPAEAFREDEARLARLLDRIADLAQEVEFFITPKAEYLVLPYWRAAVARLIALPQVQRVTVQTNLSFDVEEFLQTVNPRKLALWTTYHPTEMSEEERAALPDKWRFLKEGGIPFSVGIVGTRTNLSHLQALRRRLDPDIYLWVNAYQREPNYYRPEDLEAIRTIDPYFDLNNQYFPSRGRPCDAGHQAVYLDDEGNLRRCFFVGEVIGNLFVDGWRRLPEATPCPQPTCHCYVGQMHIVELGFREIYGENLAARIPRTFTTRSSLPTIP